MNRNYENSYQWKIDTNKVNLLLNFKHFPTDKGNDAKIVSEYRKNAKTRELKHFTVTLFGQGEGEKTIFDKYEIIFNKRMVRNSDLYLLKLWSSTREAAEGADLTKEEYVRVRQIVDQLKDEKKLKVDEHRQTIRDERSSDRGALIIYPVEYKDINNKAFFTLS